MRDLKGPISCCMLGALGAAGFAWAEAADELIQSGTDDTLTQCVAPEEVLDPLEAPTPDLRTEFADIFRSSSWTGWGAMFESALSARVTPEPLSTASLDDGLTTLAHDVGTETPGLASF